MIGRVKMFKEIQANFDILSDEVLNLLPIRYV